MITAPVELHQATAVSIGQALAEARKILADSGCAALDSDLLLGHVLGRGRAWLLSHYDFNLPAKDYVAFASLLERRSRGEPVAYLRGHVEWLDLDLLVSPAVLIPRPETEILVETAIDVAREGGFRSIADIGTGSGAVAIGLARALVSAFVIATDVSASALSVAARNLARYGLRDRVRLAKGSLLDPLTEAPGMLVANLPYLSDPMMETLDCAVRHEPVTALRGGPLGAELYRRLIDEMAIRTWFVPLVCEIDPRQRHSLDQMFVARLPSGRTRFVPDLSGHTRVAVWLPGTEGMP